MEESFFVDFLKKSSIEDLKKLEKKVRTNIIKCFDDERKNEKLDKRLYEVEMYMFREAMKDIRSYFEYGSEMPSKLSRLYWLYSSFMNIDKILEDLEKSYIKFSDFKKDMSERICIRCRKRY